MYHIFKVNDYKGGELDWETNLNKADFIEEISEQFNSEDYEDLEFEQLLEAIRAELSEPDSKNKYAGEKGLLFKTKRNGKLKELNWFDLAESITEQLIKWRE
jgi:hypothetical protein